MTTDICVYICAEHSGNQGVNKRRKEAAEEKCRAIQSLLERRGCTVHFRMMYCLSQNGSSHPFAHFLRQVEEHSLIYWSGKLNEQFTITPQQFAQLCRRNGHLPVTNGNIVKDDGHTGNSEDTKRSIESMKLPS